MTLMLNDLIDRLTSFRDKHGCIETVIVTGVARRDKVSIQLDVYTGTAGEDKPETTPVCAILAYEEDVDD